MKVQIIAQTLHLSKCTTKQRLLKLYVPLQQKENMKKGTINTAQTLPSLKCRNERTRKEQEGIQKLFIHSNEEMKEEESKKRIFFTFKNIEMSFSLENA